MTDEDFNRLEAKVDLSHEKLFVGNGTPAFAERIRVLEEDKESRRRWMGLIGGTAITGFLVAAWAGVKQLIRS